MHGVINLLKPPGMTSHDAVSFVRRVAGLKRVGHTGTLDPAASGVLPICLGQATRLAEYLQAGRKRYVAEATFGFETDTLDVVGHVVQIADANQVTRESLEAILENFRGPIRQTPPLYSAIKQDGKKLYEIARGGEEYDEAEIKVRNVEIFDLQLTQFWPGEAPRAMFSIECSGGTYIRSLVRDIARALDSAATMTFLVRTHSGNFNGDEAATLEQIAENVEGTLIPIDQVLKWCCSSVVVHDEATHLFSQGRVVPAQAWENVTPGDVTDSDALVAFVNSSGSQAAVTRLYGDNYKAEKVLNLNAADG